LSAFIDHFSQFQIQLTEYTARVNVIEQGGDGQNLIVGELSILADVPELCSGNVEAYLVNTILSGDHLSDHAASVREADQVLVQKVIGETTCSIGVIFTIAW